MAAHKCCTERLFLIYVFSLFPRWICCCFICVEKCVKAKRYHVFLGILSVSCLCSVCFVWLFQCLAYFCMLSILVQFISGHSSESKRQKRYLIFTKDTQFGVFATVSLPLPEPDNLVNVAWFLEANYYNVDNSSYFDSLLGDIVVSRSREKREARSNEIFSRSALFRIIETLLERHGYAGRSCLQRAICESAGAYYSHNGVLGDLLQLVLTPSASLSEDDLRDEYYEAEYYGLKHSCGPYCTLCPSSPLDEYSMYIDHLL